MNLKEKANEYLKIKEEISKLYKIKKKLENEIIVELEKVDEQDLTKKEIFTIDDVVTFALAYENKIEPELVKEKFPTIYNYGQKLYFSWSQAILSFEDEKEFWSLMKECRIKKPKLTVEKSGSDKKWKKNYTKTLREK